MARSCSCALPLFFLLIFATLFVSNTQGRKLLIFTGTTEEDNKSNTVPSSSFASLIFSVLPKGTVPSSSPSKKGHATLNNEQLFQRHLATINRVLRYSVPSPGVGH